MAATGQVGSDDAERFAWPEGRRAAVSLSFDDARVTQTDRGLPILDEAGLRATFYVSTELVDRRLEPWREALARGHEIGNHTFTHPCSGNFAWSRHKVSVEPSG